MTRPASPSNVASSSAATSAWANEVVDAVNAVLDDIYGAVNLEIPWASLTGVFSGSVPVTQAFGDAATAGVATQPARVDHVHGMPALGTTASTQAIGDAASGGAAATPSKSDHKHAMPAFGAVVAETAFGLASASGAAASVSRSDHAHGTPAAQTPTSLNVPTTKNTPATATTRVVFVGTSAPTGAAEGDLWVQG